MLRRVPVPRRRQHVVAPPRGLPALLLLSLVTRRAALRGAVPLPTPIEGARDIVATPPGAHGVTSLVGVDGLGCRRSLPPPRLAPRCRPTGRTPVHSSDSEPDPAGASPWRGLRPPRGGVRRCYPPRAPLYTLPAPGDLRTPWFVPHRCRQLVHHCAERHEPPCQRRFRSRPQARGRLARLWRAGSAATRDRAAQSPGTPSTGALHARAALPNWSAPASSPFLPTRTRRGQDRASTEGARGG